MSTEPHPPPLPSTEQTPEQAAELGGLWPASTGCLISSILFADKLWLLDVTSMSLYWVARLPIERPKATSPLAPRRAARKPERATAVATKGHRRQRKIALSLAIVSALAAPFVFRTYKERFIHSLSVPLTPQEHVT